VDDGAGTVEAGTPEVAGYVEGTGLMGRSLFEPGVPPCGRAYFLLLRQKKVANEKATPGCAVGCADSPALLGTGGGCGTRGYASQTVLALFPPAPVLLGAPHGDPKDVAALPVSGNMGCCGRPSKKAKNAERRLSRDGFPGPLRGAEQRRRAGGSRLALFEPKASSCEPPGPLSSARNRACPAPTQGWPSFWLLFLGHTRKSTPAGKAEHGASESQTPQSPNQKIQRQPNP
jgi:hypothetical protein